MKNKHRRLFGQNNRNAIHFFFLSADFLKSLPKGAIFWFFTLTLITSSNYGFSADQPPEVTNTQLIKKHVTRVVSSHLGEFGAEDLEVHINMPSTSVLTKACEGDLYFEWRGHPEPGQNTVKAGCSAPRWQIYIPVQIRAYKNIVVSTEPLSRNKPLDASQLGLRRLDIGKLRTGYFLDPTELSGYLLQRTIKSGQVITPYIAKAPALIKRGDWITIISGTGGLTVTSTGEAMKDGVKGEQIAVKNLRSDTIVRAWIIRKGVVSTRKNDI